MKVLSLFLATAVLSFGAANVSAGSCGAGIITHIKEGGWNEDAFLIHIDDSVGSPEHAMYRVDWVRFKNTLDPDRFRGIKALAYMAFSSGKPIRAYTSGTNCNAADDLTIFLDPALPEPS